MTRPFRLLTWNVEWFDRLFDARSEPAPTDDRSARYEVTKRRQLDAIAGVLAHVDADAALIVEAPDDSPSRSTRLALERFAERAGIRLSRAMIGFANGTRQELALMYDPAVVTPVHDPGDSPEAPRFDGPFGFDLDQDLRAETLTWSKPPLELTLDVAPGGRAHVLRLIGVHAKSKGLHGETGAAALRTHIQNRRKQLAQCIWLRRRVDQRLAEADPSGDARLIVAGDFNDGPGLDAFEALFGRSGVEIVLGDGHGALHDPHATTPRMGAAHPTTARFWDNQNKRWLNALLDFAMVSSDLRPACTWRILHPFDDPEAGREPTLRAALLDASDHFPVILDIDLSRI